MSGSQTPSTVSTASEADKTATPSHVSSVSSFKSPTSLLPSNNDAEAAAASDNSQSSSDHISSRTSSASDYKMRVLSPSHLLGVNQPGEMEERGFDLQPVLPPSDLIPDNDYEENDNKSQNYLPVPPSSERQGNTIASYKKHSVNKQSPVLQYYSSSNTDTGKRNPTNKTKRLGHRVQKASDKTIEEDLQTSTSHRSVSDGKHAKRSRSAVNTILGSESGARRLHFKPLATSDLLFTREPVATQGDETKTRQQKPAVKDGNPTLTVEELRASLYHKFRDQGLLDKLKSQLRHQVVVGLQESILRRSPFAVATEAMPLYLRALNSLVMCHLRAHGYRYTASVLAPESGTADGLTTEDVFRILGIGKNSKLYTLLMKDSSNGVLWELLSEVVERSVDGTSEASVQTDLAQPANSSTLHEKLRIVDAHYDGRKSEERGVWMTSVEDRILSFQRQLEERSRSELQLEVARFKEMELTQMRLLEQEKCRKELGNARREMEILYQSKCDALATREKNLAEQIQKEQEMLSKDAYAQRQKILEEIDTLRERETQMRRETEGHAREIALEKDKLKSWEEQLHQRALSNDKAQLQLAQRLEQWKLGYKQEQQQKYADRTCTLEASEARVKEDARRVKADEDELRRAKEEVRELSERIAQLEMQLYEAKSEMLTASKTSEALGDKVREMMDYKQVRLENAVLKNEIEHLKTKLAEEQSYRELEKTDHGRVVKELTEKLTKPSSDAVMMQRELERARAEHRQQLALLQYQQQQGDSRLQEELNRSKELIKRYEAQSRDARRLAREADDLRSQLQQTQLALHNTVRGGDPIVNDRDPIVTDRDANVSGGAPTAEHVFERTAPRVSFLDSYLTEAQASRHRFYNSEMPSHRPANRGPSAHIGGATHDGTDGDGNDNSLSSDSSLQFIQEAKERLQALTGDDELVEQRFRDYQYRVMDPHSLPAEPHAASSSSQGLPAARRDDRPYRAGHTSEHYLSVTPTKLPAGGSTCPGEAAQVSLRYGDVRFLDNNVAPCSARGDHAPSRVVAAAAATTAGGQRVLTVQDPLTRDQGSRFDSGLSAVSSHSRGCKQPQAGGSTVHQQAELGDDPAESASTCVRKSSSSAAAALITPAAALITPAASPAASPAAAAAMTPTASASVGNREAGGVQSAGRGWREQESRGDSEGDTSDTLTFGTAAVRPRQLPTKQPRQQQVPALDTATGRQGSAGGDRKEPAGGGGNTIAPAEVDSCASRGGERSAGGTLARESSGTVLPEADSDSDSLSFATYLTRRFRGKTATRTGVAPQAPPVAAAIAKREEPTDAAPGDGLMRVIGSLPVELGFTGSRETDADATQGRDAPASPQTRARTDDDVDDRGGASQVAPAVVIRGIGDVRGAVGEVTEVHEAQTEKSVEMHEPQTERSAEVHEALTDKNAEMGEAQVERDVHLRKAQTDESAEVPPAQTAGEPAEERTERSGESSEPQLRRGAREEPAAVEEVEIGVRDPLEDAGIDPVMKKYMAMVIQQREQEAKEKNEASPQQSQHTDLDLTEDLSKSDDFW
ncbi:PREDICTED: uncharacterized protein LOC106808581 [Priapulus caudatus]|uniref:Uncharacterized protein LOC106808581 n=1 Tax=Priapulus caudatus TaxID=37621 RepID=A0ABM1E3Q9_PRICU|nr:PREDICTED: uncharacterized protein LOC106808581 [Priapulus caudatus]